MPGKQWRWERAPWRTGGMEVNRWSAWDNSKSSALAFAADPEYGTGRVQERTKPAPNPVTIEVIK